MMHHLLFSDTFFLDAVFPIYLIGDSIFGLNFYQPYVMPLPISLRIDEFPWTMLIFYIYGYSFSLIYLCFPILLIRNALKDKFNKNNILRGLGFLAVWIVSWEVLLIYFGTYFVTYSFLLDLLPTGFGLLAPLIGMFIVMPVLIFLFSLPLILFAWLYGVYRRRSSIYL